MVNDFLRFRIKLEVIAYVCHGCGSKIRIDFNV
jgi:hypothetical protein